MTLESARAEMIRLYELYGILAHPEVIKASECLDRLIVTEQQMRRFLGGYKSIKIKQKGI